MMKKLAYVGSHKIKSKRRLVVRGVVWRDGCQVSPPAEACEPHVAPRCAATSVTRPLTQVCPNGPCGTPAALFSEVWEAH